MTLRHRQAAPKARDLHRAKGPCTARALPLATFDGNLQPATCSSGEELERRYQKTNVAMTPEVEQLLKSFFEKMDTNGDGSVTKEEAIAFWGSNFAKAAFPNRTLPYPTLLRYATLFF